MKSTMQLMLICLIIVIIGPVLALAGQVTVPNTFQANNPAVAAQVNANFSAVKTAVDDNNSRISTNTTNISSKQNRVTGTCPAGQSIRTINADGTVVCEVDDTGGAIPGIEYLAIGSKSNVSTTITNYGAIVITAPQSGYILVQASGNAWTWGGSTLARLGIGDSQTAFDFLSEAGLAHGSDTILRAFPISLSGVYQVSAGSKTIYLLAQKDPSYSAATVNYSQLFISAVYFPNRY